MCPSSDKNTILMLAAYVGYVGFSPQPMLLMTAVFFGARSFTQWQRTLPAWVMTLLWVLASSSSNCCMWVNTACVCVCLSGVEAGHAVWFVWDADHHSGRNLLQHAAQGGVADGEDDRPRLHRLRNRKSICPCVLVNRKSVCPRFSVCVCLHLIVLESVFCVCFFVLNAFVSLFIHCWLDAPQPHGMHCHVLSLLPPPAV